MIGYNCLYCIIFGEVKVTELLNVKFSLLGNGESQKPVDRVCSEGDSGL